ncbi:hypothetical protein ACWEPC_56380, partial [Nonomuraea sp. NPDC004297]
MHALIVDPDVPGSLRLGTAPEPEPAPHQVLIEVRHISLNRGEVAFAGQRPAGTVHGYDAAGVVVRAAGDGADRPPAHVEELGEVLLGGELVAG